MRRAKIVCTLGPATSSERRIRELVYAGMDVARLNMSHGTHEDHAEAYRLVRAAADASGHGVGIFADLQGPKIRMQTFAEGSAMLQRGQQWTITTRDVAGDASIAGTTYQGLPGDVHAGDPILIDDGKIRLRVTEVTDTDVVTEVLVGGKVSNHKGINLPGVAVSVPALSAKDEADLRFALSLSVDFIALSFVRDAKDAEDVRKIMREVGCRAPGHRQDREAPGDRQPRRGDRGVRRVHGGPRRPRRGVPARGGPVPAEAGDREGPAQRQAGDRGHPDAGIDDHQPGPHSRRGQRRRQRGARRR